VNSVPCADADLSVRCWALIGLGARLHEGRVAWQGSRWMAGHLSPVRRSLPGRTRTSICGCAAEIIVPVGAGARIHPAYVRVNLHYYQLASACCRGAHQRTTLSGPAVHCCCTARRCRRMHVVHVLMCSETALSPAGNSA